MAAESCVHYLTKYAEFPVSCSKHVSQVHQLARVTVRSLKLYKYRHVNLIYHIGDNCQLISIGTTFSWRRLMPSQSTQHSNHLDTNAHRYERPSAVSHLATMVLFMIPIPTKVVDGATDKATSLYKSYKKQPPATDLGETPEDEGPSSPPPPPPRGKSNTWNEKSPVAARAPPAAQAPAGAHVTHPTLPARQSSATYPAAPPAASTATDAFSAQLITHILNSLTLLESMGGIAPQTAKVVRLQLPIPGKASSSSPAANTSPSSAAYTAAAARPPPYQPTKPQARATALWDYGQGGDADDLVFTAGDTIIIDEEVNGEWMKGRTIPRGKSVPLSKCGLFPANYVERT